MKTNIQGSVHKLIWSLDIVKTPDYVEFRSPVQTLKVHYNYVVEKCNFFCSALPVVLIKPVKKTKQGSVKDCVC